ncbi:MAG TPA: Ppx/GppA phosphatase family protein [Telluria sp.]|nr:Ppx/GppA phosphatase family protein [Telluria sp.]
MFAAVDLGSNSFRLHIGTFEDGVMRIVETARDPIRLAAGLDPHGMLDAQALDAAEASLQQLRRVLERYRPAAVRVVATNTLRVARNAAAFLPRAEAAIGHPVEVISGEEEGRLIYMGVACALDDPAERRLVVDIGGGSTEIVLGSGPEIRAVESFGIGTQRQCAGFFADGRITAAAFDAAILSARSSFEDAAAQYDPRSWTRAYGSSGTMRAIANVIAKNGIGDGAVSLPNLLILRERLIECGHVGLFGLVGVKPERVPVLLGGLSVLIGIMQELRFDALTTVNAGLRMGVLWDLQLRASARDRRDRSVLDFARGFRADESRAAAVAGQAVRLYGQLRPATERFERYLHWAALLHEVGAAISHTGAHKHSAYMVEHADLAGFTTREQRLMATLILAQKGNLRKVAQALGEPDCTKAVLALRLAVLLMHAKIHADADQLQVRMKNRIELELPPNWLQHHPTLKVWLDKERDWWNEVGISLAVKAGG